MIRSGDAKMMSLEIKRLNGEVLDRSEWPGSARR
jgi:hypothetical protein